MKKILVLLSLVLSTSLFAETIQGQTGRYCPGSTVDMYTDGAYVERVLISAEGIRRDGFIKVYADGELVFNVGVPGYDPDYSFRIRRNVNTITLKFERTCSRLLDFKAFTQTTHKQRPYLGYSPTLNTLSWGSQLLAIINSLGVEGYGIPAYQALWNPVLLPLKKLAIAHATKAAVYDERSLEVAYYSLRIAQEIEKNKQVLDDYLSGNYYDELVIDLLTICEDILEAYDVKRRNLPREIEELAEIIDL